MSRAALTECGIDAARYPTWTRDEAFAQLDKLGKQRFGLFVCMTCWGTAGRHSTWDVDPASCMVRHADRHTFSAKGRWRRDEAVQFAAELRALGLLVAAHRDEFDETVAGILAATPLTDARASKRRQAR